MASFRVLKFLRLLYRFCYGMDTSAYPLERRTTAFVQESGQKASDAIRQLLSSGKPCMITRFGEVEMRCLANGHFVSERRSTASAIIDFIRCRSGAFWWDDRILRQMANNAGFFPSTAENCQRFCELMIDCMRDVDILGSWQENENLFEDQLRQAMRIRFCDLEPYRHSNPWTEVLSGRRVLVVHPFTASIEHQYAKRALLFPDPRILPAFSLVTVKAVQSIAGTQTRFQNWFEALEYMKCVVSVKEFDTAIIGCGAYGFPLASYIKRMGKQAVHLGGITQVLFGILGKRWEGPDFRRVADMANEHWSRPLPLERPIGADGVEEGCYW